MKIVRIQVGNVDGTFLQIRNICFPKEDCPIKIINSWDDENEFFPSTLKDISIIMNQMVGQGVTWQLANELSDRLNIDDPYKVLNILREIFREYGNLSENDAFEKYEKSPKLNK